MRILIVGILLSTAVFANSQITDTVFVESNEVQLHTVITKPKPKKKTSLVIMIPGSGPTDLEGNQPGMKNNSLLYLSDALVNKDIATLRFDKRGLQKSHNPGFNEEELRIESYAEDVVELVRYSKKLGYKNIYVLGHSEGSLIGLIALQQIKVAGYISLAGAGESIDYLLKTQLKPKLPPKIYNRAEIAIDSLKIGKTVSKYPPALHSLFRPSIQPYLISWLKYNPQELISKLEIPVLIIQGKKDIQVDENNALLLAEAAKNNDLVIIENMNHLLKEIEGGKQDNINSYSNPDLPVSSILITSIVDFITKN